MYVYSDKFLGNEKSDKFLDNEKIAILVYPYNEKVKDIKKQPFTDKNKKIYIKFFPLYFSDDIEDYKDINKKILEEIKNEEKNYLVKIKKTD